MDNIKFTDYVRIEQLKTLITNYMEKAGFKEQVRTMNNQDLAKILLMMGKLGEFIGNTENKDERIEILITYIIGLWVRLIIDYGADLEEL